MRNKLLISVLLLAFAACREDPKPGPTPDPEPTPEPTPDPTPQPQPDPVPVTCLGEPLGTIKTMKCDPGYEGSLVLVCQAAGWKVVSNTCLKTPTPTPTPTPVPTPSVPLKVILPAAYRIHKGDSVALAVKPQTGIDFTWSTGEKGELIWVAPTADKQYNVTGKRQSDSVTATASVMVLVVP